MGEFASHNRHRNRQLRKIAVEVVAEARTSGQPITSVGALLESRIAGAEMVDGLAVEADEFRRSLRSRIRARRRLAALLVASAVWFTLLGLAWALLRK